jgi:hypothetical protein
MRWEGAEEVAFAMFNLFANAAGVRPARVRPQGAFSIKGRQMTHSRPKVKAQVSINHALALQDAGSDLQK